MSSPIAKQHKTGVDRTLIATHQRLSHRRRVEMLAREFANRIEMLAANEPNRAVRILDVGCGDMTLSDAVGALLPQAEIRCVDIHPLPVELARMDPRWKRYSSFDGRHLEFPEQHFDVVMFSDVLHHVPVDLRAPLLESAGRVGRWVLIKDHLEYGWWSRQMLRTMDFIGNYGYGVTVPTRYFDRDRFQCLCRDAGLRVVELGVGIQLYAHLPLVRSLLSPDWQFMAACRRV